MAKVTNSNFISFIKAYGPWADNELQFEEYVRQNAERKHIDPLEYKSPNKNCLSVIDNVLSRPESQILLICGCAGDGKTHLLGQIFEDPKLLNLGTEQFKQLLSTQSSVRFIEDVRGFDLTVVGDLSQTPDNEPDEQLLMSNILQVLAANSSQKASLEDSLKGAEASGARSSGARDSGAKSYGAEPSGVESAAEKASGAKCSAVRPHLVVIAGNNGKILEKINTLLERLHQFISSHNSLAESEHCTFMQVNWTLAQYQSIAQEVRKLRDSLKHSFIEKQKLSIPHVTLIDMSNRIDREVLQEIFDVILNHPKWSACQECTCFDQCPIRRNREILSYPWLQERLFNVLHLLKADGFLLTIRTVQYLLVNGLLGRGFEADAKSNDLTCMKIKNNVEANNGLCTFSSNAYDNLLGLNFKPESRFGRSIFKALDSLNLGKCTSRQIDDFLLEQSGPFELEVCKKLVQRFDSFGVHQALMEAWDDLRTNSLDFVKNNKAEQESSQKQFTSKLQAMRRILFFSLGAPFSEEDMLSTNSDDDMVSTNNSVRYDYSPDLCFMPYLMTCYPHAREYFDLEQLVEENNPDHIRSSYTAQKLILALNRLFTGLYTSEDTDYLYVPANHINNLSIIYSESVFKFKSYAYSIERTIDLVKSSEYALPALQFKDMARNEAEDKTLSSRVHTDLVLTPYMFECLMQIADGVSSKCLPKQAIHEAVVFKNKIYSILEQQISTLLENTNTNSLLDAIRQLEVEAGGRIVPRNQMSNRV